MDTLKGSTICKQRRGDQVSGNGFPRKVRDVCVRDYCRKWMWCLNQKSSLLGAARDRNSLFTGTCLFEHGERSKCACGVRTQQSCRMNMSHCAQSEIQVWPQRENAAVFSRMNLFLCSWIEIDVFLRADCDPTVPPWPKRSIMVCMNLSGGAGSQQSFRWNMCLCAWRQIHVLAA